MKRIGIGLAAVLALAACSQQNAPSEQLQKEATDLVEKATGNQTEPETAATGPYAPRDECGDLAGAEPFLAMLRGAVAGRDAEAFAALAAEDVKLDFGGGAGRATLLKQLNAPDSAMWPMLDRLLTLGCATNAQGGITLPWYFAQDDIPVDPMMGMIVTGENVPLREEPDLNANEITQVSWDAVEAIAELQSVEGWRHVRLPAKDAEPERTGWIRENDLRSLIGYRLIASSRNKSWRITSLVAGD